MNKIEAEDLSLSGRDINLLMLDDYEQNQYEKTKTQYIRQGYNNLSLNICFVSESLGLLCSVQNRRPNYLVRLFD